MNGDQLYFLKYAIKASDSKPVGYSALHQNDYLLHLPPDPGPWSFLSVAIFKWQRGKSIPQHWEILSCIFQATGWWNASRVHSSMNTLFLYDSQEAQEKQLSTNFCLQETLTFQSSLLPIKKNSHLHLLVSGPTISLSTCRHRNDPNKWHPSHYPWNLSLCFILDLEPWVSRFTLNLNKECNFKPSTGTHPDWP